MGRVSTAKEDLIGAATDLLWSRGFVDVGVAELCKTAGVRPGSFYHFFASKSELGVAVIAQHLDSTRRWVLEPARQRADAVERLHFYLRKVGDVQVRMAGEGGQVCGCPFGNLTGEISALGTGMRDAISAASEELEGFFTEIATDAVAQGVSTATNASDIGKALFAFVEGVLLMARMRNDASLIAAMAPQAEKLLRA